MEYNTSQLCDIYQDQVDVVEPMFSTFGGRSSFGGQVTTIKCFEANGIIRQVVKENGVGRVLLIDGGGSLRRALIDQILQLPLPITVGKGSSATVRSAKWMRWPSWKLVFRRLLQFLSVRMMKIPVTANYR